MSSKPDGTRSVRARQPADGELDAVAGQHAPGFDLGQVGGLRKTAEHLARLLARGLARQRKGLAPEGVPRGRTLGERFRRAAGDVGGAAGGVHGANLKRNVVRTGGGASRLRWLPPLHRESLYAFRLISS